MALSEWISYKNAEWTHEDNQAKVRATERETDEKIRTNKANEAIKREQLAFEKEKFPVEQETSRYGAYYRGLGAKEAEIRTLPQQQMYALEQINVKERESNARALLSSSTQQITTSSQVSGNILSTKIKSGTDLSVAKIQAENKLDTANVKLSIPGFSLSVPKITSDQVADAAKSAAIDWLASAFSG